MRIQNNPITGNTEFRVTAGECGRVREFITAYNYQPSNMKKVFTYTPGVFTYRTLVESIPTQVDNDWVELLTWMDVRAGMDERNAGMKHVVSHAVKTETAGFKDILADCLDDEGVDGLLSKLTARQKNLIIKRLHGWKYSEIATLEGVDESAVRDAMRRAKINLRKLL